jgi:cytochrome b561
VQGAHNALGIAIVALLVLHVGAAVFHQAIRRDGTLLRMV